MEVWMDFISKGFLQRWRLQVEDFDPEPRRLHKAAINHDRQYTASNVLDDEEWAEL